MQKVGEDDSIRQGQRKMFRNYRFDLRALGRQLLWMAVGSSLYLLLPLRASANPPVNWGNVNSLSRLAWLVSGRLYQGAFLLLDPSHFWLRAQDWPGFILTQFSLLALALALLGLILFMRVSRLMLLTLWTALTSLAFVFFYRPVDAEVYLIPLLLSFSIWLGIGAAGLAGKLSRRSSRLGWGAAILILVMVLVRPVYYFHEVDASRDQAAEDFGPEVLSAAPQNAILFTEGDQALFALWYFRFALQQRGDLVVVSKELLPYDWYQETLRATYPALSVPGPMVFPETVTEANSLRPVCAVRYFNDRVELSCTEGSTIP
jgi:hypothetical protein